MGRRPRRMVAVGHGAPVSQVGSAEGVLRRLGKAKLATAVFTRAPLVTRGSTLVLVFRLPC